MSAGGSQVSSSLTDRIYLHIYDYETKEFSGLTTYHGLVRIYNSNTWPSRIFWCVVVLSCLSLFMIHSGYLLLGYHSKPTLFQVNTLVPRDGLLFPGITICSNNPLDPRKLRNWNISDSLAAYLTNGYSQYIVANYSKALYEEYLQLTSHGAFDISEFLQSVALDCSDVIVSCAFAGRHVPDCCSLTELVVTDVGPCFRISEEKAKKRQWYSGSGFGWQFVLDGKNHWKTDKLADQFQDDGVRILLHPGGATMRSRSVAAPPGTSVFVTIDAKNISLLPRADWGICQREWDPDVTGDVLLPLPYSAVHCEWNNEAGRWLSTCGCVPLHLHYNSSHSVCDPFQITNCQSYLLGSTASHICDTECDFMQYETSHSYADLGPRGFYSEKRYSADYIENSITVAWLYFRTITVERNEQQKQLQTADLLSNIAGSMGLFLGMSTVTLLEIFIYLFKSVWGTVNTERQEQFLQAMMEEEEERRQSLVIVEGPVEQAEDEEEGQPEGANPPRKASIMPTLHLHLDRGRTPFGRRDSGLLAIRRDSSVFGSRRDSSALDTLQVPRRSISVAPLLHPHRQSIAFGALNRRGSHLDPTENAPPSRRGSGVPTIARLAVPTAGPRRLSAQPLDDAYHLAYNQSRRRSSVHLRNLLL